MSLLQIASLSVVLLTLAALPSSSVALVIARTTSHGLNQGLCVAAGIATSDCFFAVLVLFGLSFIAETMGWVFTFIKYGAAIYLIWLGVGILRSLNEKPPIEISLERKNNKSSMGIIKTSIVSFLSGFLFTLADIKAVFFYLSLFPVFVDLTSISSKDIVIIMTITIVCVGGVKAAYALLAHKWLGSFKSLKRMAIIKPAAAVAMIGSGLYLALKP